MPPACNGCAPHCRMPNARKLLCIKSLTTCRCGETLAMPKQHLSAHSFQLPRLFQHCTFPARYFCVLRLPRCLDIQGQKKHCWHKCRKENQSVIWWNTFVHHLRPRYEELLYIIPWQIQISTRVDGFRWLNERLMVSATHHALRQKLAAVAAYTSKHLLFRRLRVGLPRLVHPLLWCHWYCYSCLIWEWALTWKNVVHPLRKEATMQRHLPMMDLCNMFQTVDELF
mmetsp:Transcript_18348/g.31683  ORF Transcript_18348/g.31683 Transcript_18348/m.31683 type:complete len:226 (-) Transcript_18348:1205-1882(-)